MLKMSEVVILHHHALSSDSPLARRRQKRQSRRADSPPSALGFGEPANALREFPPGSIYSKDGKNSSFNPPGVDNEISTVIGVLYSSPLVGTSKA